MKTTLVLVRPWDWTLVQNWRQVPKKISVQALALVGLLQGIELALPATGLATKIPFVEATWGEVFVGAKMVFTIIGLVGAYIDQQIPPVDPPPAA